MFYISYLAFFYTRILSTRTLLNIVLSQWVSVWVGRCVCSWNKWKNLPGDISSSHFPQLCWRTGAFTVPMDGEWSNLPHLSINCNITIQLRNQSCCNVLVVLYNACMRALLQGSISDLYRCGYMYTIRYLDGHVPKTSWGTVQHFVVVNFISNCTGTNKD